METQEQSGTALLSLKELPSIVWYIVASSSGLALILILVMVILGYRDGLQRGEAQKRQQVAIMLQRASDMLENGQPQEALAAYRKILQFDPENEAARNAIPAVEAISTVEPVPVEETVPSAVDLEWAKALKLHDAGRWQEAIQAFSLVQSMQADYRSIEMKQNLFISYVELARAVTAEGSLEEAVQLFDKALEMNANEPLIQQERHMTAQYVDVKTYWGADWAQVILLLEDLYQIDPEYRDVRFLLQRAHVQQGESLAGEEEWCAAASEFTSAIAVLDWLELRGRRDELAALCRNANGG